MFDLWQSVKKEHVCWCIVVFNCVGGGTLCIITVFNMKNLTFYFLQIEVVVFDKSIEGCNQMFLFVFLFINESIIRSPR